MYSCPIVWFHNTLLGIRRSAEMFVEHRFELTPYLPSSLSFAKGEYMTDAGKIAVSWKKEDGGALLSVTIPKGITAAIRPQNMRIEGAEEVCVSGETRTFRLIHADAGASFEAARKLYDNLIGIR